MMRTSSFPVARTIAAIAAIGLVAAACATSLHAAGVADVERLGRGLPLQLDSSPVAGGPAQATAVATRVPVTTCQQVAEAVARSRPSQQQVIVVLAASFASVSGTLQIATRSGAGWTCDATRFAQLGRNGTRPLLQRRSGDGTTPAGVFPLATMTAYDGRTFSFFGNSPDPGVSAGPYRWVQTGDCFGATPNTPGYGHLRYQVNCPGPDDEYLPNLPTTYSHAALIGANMEPDVSGDAPGEIPYASAIFLHRHTYTSSGAVKPTSGCVSLNASNLSDVLVAMRPGVVFAIGPADWLLANA